MIRILATALLVLCLTASGSFATSEGDLIYIDGLAYKKCSDVVFTGEVDEGEHRGAIKNGIFEGLWFGYWPNGRVEFMGEYKNGTREGPWANYYDDGQLSYKGAFKKGTREGLWVGYWSNGRVEFKGTFKNGQREGPWVRYSIIGQLWLRGAFENGKHEGPWLWYNEDGTTDEDLSGTYRNDVKVSD
jgi:antitoxin component YwqK of YwqJK toxin-antitoxin module